MKLLAFAISLLAVAVVSAAFIFSHAHHSRPCHQGIYGKVCSSGGLYGR